VFIYGEYKGIKPLVKAINLWNNGYRINNFGSDNSRPYIEPQQNSVIILPDFYDDDFWFYKNNAHQRHNPSTALPLTRGFQPGIEAIKSEINRHVSQSDLCTIILGEAKKEWRESMMIDSFACELAITATEMHKPVIVLSDLDTGKHQESLKKIHAYGAAIHGYHRSDSDAKLDLAQVFIDGLEMQLPPWD